MTKIHSNSSNNNVSFFLLLIQLGGIIKKAFYEVRTPIIVFILVFGWLSLSIFNWINISYVYTCFVGLSFLCIAILVYFLKGSYIESLIILVTGLFAVFSVEWNASKFTLFALAFILFNCLTVIAYSIKEASKHEQFIIYAENNYLPNIINASDIKSEWLKAENIKYKELVSIDERRDAFLFFTITKVPVKKISYLVEKCINFKLSRQISFQESSKILSFLYRYSLGKQLDFDELVEKFTNFLYRSLLPPNKFLENFYNRMESDIEFHDDKDNFNEFMADFLKLKK